MVDRAERDLTAQLQAEQPVYIALEPALAKYIHRKCEKSCADGQIS
jgi:hypothetical protein